MTALLGTKLRQPSPPARRVQRPLLIRRLNEGLESGRQITLVSAPAGYGKTTCVSEWVGTLHRLPVSWLSLDPADDDPARFFAYLLAALQRIDARLGREIQGVLRAGELAPSQVISTGLVNDILQLESRFLLVLDDLQVIQDRFILQVLEDLVTSLPQPLHLVLLTREDPPLPLARPRASNRLTEIRAADLRFSTGEAASFLHEVLGLSLPEADVAVLEDKTEGWVAGLQLAGLSVQERDDPSGFIAGLSGSHRFILSYLTEEVLSRQPEAVRQFVLQTSILERLNGELCDAVTGRSDGRAVLERLYNANLFLIPLDDEGQWYRYHHLFADLIRDLQQAEHRDETAELHRRASRWYAQAGMASEAIEHALAAADYSAAVELLEGQATEMVMQGYAKTVHGWVQAIPAEWGSQSPRTNLAFAWMHLLRGAYAQASLYLERSQAAIEGTPAGPQPGEEQASLRAEGLVMRSLVEYMQGRAKECLEVARQALEIAPEQDSGVRSLAYYALASARVLIGDYGGAAEAYQESVRHGRAAGNLVAEMMSTVGLAEMAFERGQLHLAEEVAGEASVRVERSGALPPICVVIYGLLGEVYYHWYRIEDGRRHTQRALQLGTLGGYNTALIGCRVLLSRLYQIEGDLGAAACEMQQAADLMQADTPDYVRQEAVAQQVRLYLAQDRAAAAEMALQGEGFSFEDRLSCPDLPPGRSIPHSVGLLYNSALRLLLQQARAGGDPANLRPGIELAGRLIAGALQGQYTVAALEALLLRAQMQAMLGDEPASRADYLQALAMAEPEGFIGVFVDQGPPMAQALASLLRESRLGAVPPGYVEDILAAFSRSPGAAAGEERVPVPPALVEPLTGRELEVLRAMAEGLKYREIAGRLFITLNTVRFHVKAIYGKLAVSNRTQAIERARRLGML